MMNVATSGSSPKSVNPHRWALVLAAGEGRRLRSLTTTPAGISVPKQFCSLHGGSSLLDDAVRRAQAIVMPQHVCAVVAADHRHWWTSLSESIPLANIIVQPDNRGTANGLLLPLLHIFRRDPEAILLVLPSDHYVRNEGVLAATLADTAAHLESGCADIVMLGLTPEEADTELGYILPAGGADVGGASHISSFAEKPDGPQARELIGQGGLWNSFIFLARASALVQLFERQFPEIVMEMRGVLEHSGHDPQGGPSLAELYRRLPVIDFSRDVVERFARQFKVMRVPPCGWSDLGTPRRVAEVLNRAEVPNRGRRSHRAGVSGERYVGGFLDLASQYLEWQSQVPASRGMMT
ncbi:mannose-1-phosphate guanylyltransferase [Steroidobacter denitrificans]|uniref:Mannose-1-phosphate guanylyltransferase n=1 Tax=Steroidobacter denitrificans TaxID=465721 RepID=A0A127F9I7_STEDE|nr:sugar phosphate nucleotidyltransferase [Steroidobacter denitrificans]AMN46278.1 mannose-1-phosphate guanylyltransferase [Steroidobacter denitrificans]